MKIVAISDIHERTGKIDKLRLELRDEMFNPDIVIIAGDMTYFKNVKTALNILAKIKDILNAKVLFVPGNCDHPDLLGVTGLGEEILNIHLRPVRISDFVFYGIGGGGISPFNTLIEYSEEEFRNFMSKLENFIFNEILILVTHQPIYGYFDDVNGEKIGSKAFAEYLAKIEPFLWITGHVHENSGWIRVNKTTIVHPGPFMRGYYALIEVADINLSRVEVRRIRDLF